MISRRETGQGLVEYALLVALVVVVVTLVLIVTGTSVSDVYCRVARGLVGSTGSCAHYFVDDFTNLNAWTRVSGNWQNPNGQLCGGTGEGRIFVPLTQGDYVITVKMAVLQQGNGYGIYFRANNLNQVDGYTFQYDPGYASSFIFRKWVRGNELSPFAVAAAPGFAWWNTPREIRVVARGNRFTAFVDGQQVLTGTDNTYATGGVGFRTWSNTRACFDDLSVDPLP